MAKAKNCGTCGYAEWPKNKVGHRLKKGYAGKCLCPLPDLPHCVPMNLYKNAICSDLGEGCPNWRNEDHGLPQDAERPPVLVDRNRPS